MAQYIDKSALVAEIEKIIEEPAPSHDQQCPWEDGYYCGLYKAESIIDTLKVKDVDLEKELDEWVKYGPHTNYPWCTIPDAIKITAEHFFELGMSVSNKADKGE